MNKSRCCPARPALSRLCYALSVSLAVASGALLGACLEPLPDALDRPARDASVDAREAPPRVGLGEIIALDARGTMRETHAAPRRVTLRLALDGRVNAPAGAIFLLRGAPNADLLGDLTSAPLRVDTLARAVPIAIDSVDGALHVRPIGALAMGAEYTLVVGAWLEDTHEERVLGAPRAVALRVSSAPDDGATRVDSWPPDGAPGVGPNLPFVALRFDGRVVGARDAVYLSRADGAPVAAELSEPPCAEIGWASGYCVVVTPHAPLVGGTAYALIAGESLRDGSGAPIGESASRFTTSSADDVSPPLPAEDEPCALDETALEGGGCLLADDRSLSLRLRTSEPVRAFFSVRHGGTRREVAVVSPRGDVALSLRALTPDTAFEATLYLIDAAGLEVERHVSLSTTVALASLSITEVRSDPRGAEPRQEYVEVLNFGAVPVDLRDFSLSDRADDEGDRVTRAFLLPAGARVLFVADAFDADDANDDAPAPGVPLVRIGTSIGSGGLSNAGEPLFLRDPGGRRVSASPAMAARAAGACVVRSAADPRDGSSAAFAHDALDGCTPGLADRSATP